MREFTSELGSNYETYTFGYANYAEREPDDSLSLIYQTGHLPYSGSPDAKDIFYMARSARVRLADFTLSSENRRIAKKFDTQFTKEHVQNFMPDAAFYDFCIAYFAQKHGPAAMPRERLEYILSCGLVTSTSIYRSASGIAAYVLEVEEDRLGHYWFSFYDLAYAGQSLGLWLMQDCLTDAKERGLEYYYLGTVYGEKALYKTNFAPLQWWDGSEWNTDIKLLKERGRSDVMRNLPLTDEWKSGRSLFA